MNEKAQKSVGFILLHGAGLGAWIWEDLIPELEYPCLTVDFPGRGRHSDMATNGLSLNNYVESVLSDLDQFNPRKLVIVAHSISGIIGLEVARQRRDRVAGFIALSASIPAANGSYISSLPFFSGVFLRLMLLFSGTKPPDSVIRNGLCNDLDDKRASEVIDRFLPESKRLYTDHLQAQGVPGNSLYIHLKKDRALSEGVQARMIRNLHAKQIVDMDSGHLPMLSKPKELSQILNAFAFSLLY